MKNLFYLIIFFVLVNCSNNKGVYWCGDHPCINKNEKEAYFKKTMTVEMKTLKKVKLKKLSEIEKIMQQARSEKKSVIKEEKKLAKREKLVAKRMIKEEKKITKQAKLEAKRKIKEEKELAKQIELDEKKTIKKEAKISKKDDDIKEAFENIEFGSNKFSEIVEKITRKNSFKPYPDINNIPN